MKRLPNGTTAVLIEHFDEDHIAADMTISVIVTPPPWFRRRQTDPDFDPDFDPASQVECFEGLPNWDALVRSLEYGLPYGTMYFGLRNRADAEVCLHWLRHRGAIKPVCERCGYTDEYAEGWCHKAGAHLCADCATSFDYWWGRGEPDKSGDDTVGDRQRDGI